MKKYIWLLAMGLLFVNCSNDDNIIPEPEIEQEKPVQTVDDYPVQDFIWTVMNTFYFWQGDVPELADSKATNEDDYVSFLSENDDPASFFYDRLLFSEDRFSAVSDDYRDLVNSLQGISKSNGLEFGLSFFGNNNEVFGYVQYVIKNSNASSSDIRRGDIFVTVDGNQLYYNSAEDNNLDLLFGSNDTYTLGMADIVDQTIVPNGTEITLTKQEGLGEDPIFIDKVIEQGGIKVGYLMYNMFLADYDDKLNDVFGNFSDQGISELILDFRYNPGGRVTSAIQIASSVYGTQTDEIFIRPRFNNKLQQDFGTPDYFTDVTFDSETPINTLKLDRVYVITTEATASASELVINGLEPYVDVIQIGTVTTGKNEFSNTFVDDPENAYFYDPDRVNEINPNNMWAIQPLLGRNENADGFSDYTSGLVPDYQLEEDIANLGTLGDENEPLLARTLSVISGTTAKADFAPEFPVKYVTNSKMFKFEGSSMLMDGLIKPKKTTH
ncbi:S41 family peptidase [Pareuzebyella sediminis]|uniref:S41 family peptidase n=1 Tax=Pareuzebyella sediminis TaxID=2607998 RepID=UPI0011EC5AA7|nr:S41 family peptidase [Pareuzebyella sediminis]